MSFPLDNPIFQVLYWLINTPGIGGIAVICIGGGLVLSYSLLLRWISAGDASPEKETYPYPTSGLHHP